MSTNTYIHRVYPNRDTHFYPTKQYVEKYGSHTIAWQDSRIEKIENFVIEKDLRFITVPKNNGMQGNEFREYVISEYPDCIPLDFYCAKSIWERDLYKAALKNLWFRTYEIGSGHRLGTLNFFGTIATDGTRDHIVSFRYNNPLVPKNEEFLFYEGNDSWFSCQDYAVVFTTEFSKTLLSG